MKRSIAIQNYTDRPGNIEAIQEFTAEFLLNLKEMKTATEDAKGFFELESWNLVCTNGETEEFKEEEG